MDTPRDPDSTHTSGETPPARGASPRSVGRFRLERELGRGGMGVVYQALDPQLGRRVAIKLLSANHNPRAQERFAREARSMARLKHPHVVALHESGRTPTGQHFLVMDFIEGASLDALLEAGPLEPRRAARVLQEAAEGVAAAHRAGILHRDLKPGNVLVEAESGRAQVLDFGLARLLDGEERLTRTGELVGTPAYMAPEQIQSGGKQLGPTTDVYALGAVLYAALTGERPFEEGGVALLSAILQRPPDPPSQHQPSIPPALDAIVLRCLAKAPRDRYPDAPALALDLQRFLAGELRAPRVRRGRRLPLVVAALVLLGLVLGLSSGIWVSVRARERGRLLAELHAFEAEQGLERWRLGLEGTAPAPAPEALQSALADLARARELGPPPPELHQLAELEGSFRAQLRLIAASTGEPPRVAATPDGNALALLVDALLLADTGRHRQALERLELAKTRAAGSRAELMQAAMRRCLGTSLDAELGEAAGREPGVIRSGQDELFRVATRLGVAAEELASAKRAALERAVERWATEQAPHLVRPTRPQAMHRVTRIAAVLRGGCAVEPGPEFRARVLDPLVETFLEGEFRPGRVLDAIHVENALFYRCDPTRRAPPELVQRVDRLIVLEQRIGTRELEVLLFCLRHDIKTVQLDGFAGTLRSIPKARLEELARRRPGSRALACCLLELGLTTPRPKSTARYQAVVDAARAALAAPLDDLGPGYQHLLYHRLSENLWYLGQRSEGSRARELAEESVTTLRAGLPCARAWSPGMERVFLRRIADRTFQAEGLEGSIREWRVATEVAKRRLHEASDKGKTERMVALGIWQQQMLEFGWFLVFHELPEEARRVADEVLTAPFALGGEVRRAEARALCADLALRRGDVTAAARELGSEVEVGIRLNSRYAWVAVCLAEKQGDPGLARARALLGLRFHPAAAPLHQWLRQQRARESPQAEATPPE